MTRRVVILGAIVLTCLSAVAQLAEAFTARDMTGRELTLAAPPKRIVSLVPSVTEILYALGAERLLVGVTDFCDFPPEARTQPKVGGMVAPSLEAIVALKPDLVIATTEGTREDTVTQLSRLKIAVYLVSAHQVADVTSLIRRLGELTGSESSAGPLVARLEQRVEAVKKAVGPHARPRVLYVLWPEPLIVPGRGALVTELIQIAGGQSLTADDPDAWPRYSLEAAVARSPEVILLANHGAGTGAVEVEKWRRLASLPAVKSGRLISVNGDLMHRYGPRFVDGLEQLARAIHPEAFR
ncbi:MAG TPA: cobalamin-binding protein [Methylomirabilota bacterium]|nr:cobalamin-binding protein [Methylomirabilota bacterium]